MGIKKRLTFFKRLKRALCDSLTAEYSHYLKWKGFGEPIELKDRTCFRLERERGLDFYVYIWKDSSLATITVSWEEPVSTLYFETEFNIELEDLRNTLDELLEIEVVEEEFKVNTSYLKNVPSDLEGDLRVRSHVTEALDRFNETIEEINRCW